MRKYHDIVPNNSRLWLSHIKRRAVRWAGSFINLSLRDAYIKKEADSWPEGMAVLVKMRWQQDFFTIVKENGCLRLISKNSLLGSTVRLCFKNLNAAWQVFSDQKSMLDAFAEGQFYMEGEDKLCLSLLRCFKHSSLTMKNISLIKKILKREA